MAVGWCRNLMQIVTIRQVSSSDRSDESGRNQNKKAVVNLAIDCGSSVTCARESRTRTPRSCSAKYHRLLCTHRQWATHQEQRPLSQKPKGFSLSSGLNHILWRERKRVPGASPTTHTFTTRPCHTTSAISMSNDESESDCGDKRSDGWGDVTDACADDGAEDAAAEARGDSAPTNGMA